MAEEEHKNVVKGPSTWVSVAEWIVIAAFVAGVLFGWFHFSLLAFSWIYKLSVHFHYLP